MSGRMDIKLAFCIAGELRSRVVLVGWLELHIIFDIRSIVIGTGDMFRAGEAILAGI